jgi:hypothetical protein
MAALAPIIPDGLARAQIVLVGLLSLTTLLTFLVAWRRIGLLAGLWAAAFLVVWSPVFGFGKLWHESFLAPLYLLLFLLFDACARRRSLLPLLLAGFLGGIAALFKQHAVLVLLAFAFWTALTRWLDHRSVRLALRDLALMGLASLVPLAAFSVCQYARAGSLDAFFYWTVGYSLTGGYGSEAAMAPTRAQIGSLASSCILLPAAFVGFIDSRREGSREWQTVALAFLLLVTASLTAYPRFSFFHLQAALPFLAWLSAWALARAVRAGGSGRRFALAMAVALSAFWLVTAGAPYRVVLSAPAERAVQEYSDLVPLAQQIRRVIGPEECPYLFPDDEATANLYYLLNCSTPSFWVFHYPWYSLDWIQDRIASTLMEQPPDWVVYFPGRWDAETRLPEVAAYVRDHYERQATLDWVGGEAQLLGPRQ